MTERQKRLNEVYEHLRKYYGIHTQTDFAFALKYSRSVISAALNGKEDYLTDKLFKNICEAYPMTFNLDYLLNGMGNLLTIDEEMSNERIDKLARLDERPIDSSSLVNAALAAKDETIAAKQETINHLQKRLDEKDILIATLRARISDMERLSSIPLVDPLRKYPFEIGVAESDERPRL